MFKAKTMARKKGCSGKRRRVSLTKSSNRMHHLILHRTKCALKYANKKDRDRFRERVREREKEGEREYDECERCTKKLSLQSSTKLSHT